MVLTVSIGVAVVGPDIRRTPGGALQLADEALYRRSHTAVTVSKSWTTRSTGCWSPASFPGKLADTLRQSIKQGGIKH